MARFKWIYHLRNFGAALPLLFSVIFNYRQIEAEWPIWGIGGAIFLTGIAIRIWAQQHLHYRMGIHKQLTTTGPYRLVRNPLYIANILTYVGATFFSELIWFAPVTMLWGIGAYSLVIRYEEEHLLEKYGDSYQEYLQEVPRWIPKKTALRDLRLRNFVLINGYLKQAVVVELPCMLIALPFVVIEIAG